MLMKTRKQTKLSPILPVAVAVIALVGMIASARGEWKTKDTTNTSFGPVRHIDAGLLNVGYVETGPADGRPVILLHGWPYDIQSFAEVAPLLAKDGYRVIVPYLRGYGTTRFLSNDTLRNGQPSAVAVD